MKRYIILDLDGTIINSENTIESEFLRAVELYKKEYLENAKYSRKTVSGMGYRDFLATIFETKEDIDYMEKKVQEILERSKLGFTPFPKAVETIETLSKNYTLFLSTWCYTNVAIDILTHLDILKYFAHVQGSEIIPKSLKHIEICKDITLDPEFEKYALSVGDGTVEKQVAQQANIDFIQVGGSQTNAYYISSIAELWDYVEHFSSTHSIEIDGQNYML